MESAAKRGDGRFGTVVVGGGAAGLMAAISAARAGHRVLLLEGNDRLGRKILISGNGRCNLTNLDADNPVHFHSRQPRFVRPALSQFTLGQTLEFFADLGLETKEEKRGRLFPVSDQAQSVVDLLADALTQSGGDVAFGAKVHAVERAEEGFVVQAADGRQWQAARVVLASGGISLGKLGAHRGGMDIAASLGHTVTPLLPGLVPLESPDRHIKRLQGVKVWACVQGPDLQGKTVADTDDLLLTKYGVSGFTILNLSARIVPLLQEGPVELSVNLFPGTSPEQLSEKLQRRWQNQPHRTLLASFAGLLHGKVARAALAKLGMDEATPVSGLTKAARWQLARILTGWKVVVTQARGFDYAEVTIGGIATDEVNPHTLESYVVPGLYLAGEILDVHGDLGGYNFQWAWSSGHVAGQGL